ncbi:MAG: non-homologous end-joining DNA ligase [Nanoarchaeota archaeon]
MKFKPMLAIAGTKKYLSQKNFIFEPKLDGYRALCYKNDELKLITRNGIDITWDFPELNFSKNINAKNAVIDGEIIIYDKNGNPNFQLLQQRKLMKNYSCFVAFDILMKDNIDITERSLWERKKILDDTIKENKKIQKIFFTKEGDKLWKVIEQRKLEGVIAKNLNSSYEQKRSLNWIKIKIVKTTDCIILGYKTKKRKISSLVMGAYDKNNNLIILGKVGTGFKERNLIELDKLFDSLKLDEAIFQIDELKEKNITWLKPILVCEISYAEVTQDKKLRAPSFIRLRPDKSANECTLKANFDENNLKRFSEI